MASKTYIGITVYDDLSTATPQSVKWWDLEAILATGWKTYNSSNKTYLAHLNRRIKKYVANGEQLTAVFNKLVLGRSCTRRQIFNAYEAASCNFLAGGNACNLQVGSDTGGNVLNCGALTTVGKGTGLTLTRAALACAQAGCAAYQGEILSLLGSRGDVKVRSQNTYGTMVKEYGQNTVPDKVKAYTLRQKGGDLLISLDVKSGQYLTGGGCSTHVTFLSGLLFEAGNVYTGNYGDNATMAREQQVSLHNVRQVTRIANGGHTISQADWRAIMFTLFATGVNMGTFGITRSYRNACGNAPHDISAPGLGTRY